MEWSPTRTSGLARLAEFAPKAGRAYASTRNYDDGLERANVSLLSPWLHAGAISEAEVLDAVLSRHSASAAEKFIAEVFWRIYFKGYLEQRPEIWADFCEARDIALSSLDENSGRHTAYAEAVEGRTGIAAFDHWARELVETGYLHNHARMWFASIWIFTLKLDWQLGADFFLRHLIDGDAASNTLSWRWVGGLHTKGKTYLARRSNIARYTANQPGGPLDAAGLAGAAERLEESRDYRCKPLDLPRAALPAQFEQPFALLLHDEAASHDPLRLNRPPALVIGAARPGARSPRAIGAKSARFASEVVSNGLKEAASAFSCPTEDWSAHGESLTDILDRNRISAIAVPYLPTGWTRDALLPEIDRIAESGRATFLLDELNRATWPYAKAGFFGVKKKIGTILRELNISGVDENAQAELPLS